MRRGGAVAVRLLHRALQGASRALQRTHDALVELPLLFHGPEVERVVLAEAYAAMRHYTGEENQSSGLHPFEARALSAHFPRPPARLLLHGAGGGRELFSLAERGYEVDAYEPVAALAAAASARAERSRLPPVRPASLQEWARVPEGRYDGVITGWGMWSHLLRQADRLEALAAFRRVCPQGPVLLSFWRQEPTFDQHERQAPAAPLHPVPRRRLQRLTRGLLRQRLLRAPPLERGTHWSRGMYFHLVTEGELVEEAAASGYRVAHYERDGSRYPNAVLLPADGPSLNRE